MRPDEKVNILLVDDQSSKLLTYEVILRELGENLIKASSGKEALASCCWIFVLPTCRGTVHTVKQ